MADAGVAMSADERKPRRSRPLTADEHALWSHVTRSVAPLRRRRPQQEADSDRHRLFQQMERAWLAMAAQVERTDDLMLKMRALRNKSLN